MIALVGAALRAELAPRGHPDPLAMSAYYLSASSGGPATIDTDVIRSGRTMATATASLSQVDAEGRAVERIRTLATYGDLAALPEEVHVTMPMPDVPPPEQCIARPAAPDPLLLDAPFLDRIEFRLDPATAGWAVGEPAGRGLIQGWLRMTDEREPDPLLLLLAVDALPPVTFDFGHYGWVPTLELSVHVRGKPGPGWLFVRHRTRNYLGGMLEEDAEVWDSTGRLVAQSRQLARAPRQSS